MDKIGLILVGGFNRANQTVTGSLLTLANHNSEWKEINLGPIQSLRNNHLSFATSGKKSFCGKDFFIKVLSGAFFHLLKNHYQMSNL